MNSFRLLAFFTCSICLAAPPENKMKHMEEIRDCTLCHDAKKDKADRSGLHFLDGEPVRSKMVAPLCSQCHGIRARDWRKGIHGRVTGGWAGTQQRTDCIKCHEPHDPGFKPMEPVAAPIRPRLGQPKGHSSSGSH